MSAASRVFYGVLAAYALPSEIAAAAIALGPTACTAGSTDGHCAGSGFGLAGSKPPHGRDGATTSGNAMIQRGVRSSRKTLAEQLGELQLGADCTVENNDPYRTGTFVQCCDGLEKSLNIWDQDGRWYYQCKPAATGEASAPTPAEAPPATSTENAGSIILSIFEWNVHYSNKDTKGIAGVIKSSYPDVIGLCELTASPIQMATDLSSALGREYKLQPGRSGWQGYGTDIFYDNTKWSGVEGGVEKVFCDGTQGGERAANWVVLQHRASQQFLVSGGIHLTYCANGCDSTHQCELTKLYNHLEEMRGKYPGAAVVWMGDLNRGMNTHIVQDLLQGKMGGKSTFAVEDLAETQGNTYFTGGSAIDHILGEQGQFVRKGGGRVPGQGITGQHLSGADHFPIFAQIELSR